MCYMFHKMKYLNLEILSITTYHYTIRGAMSVCQPVLTSRSNDSNYLLKPCRMVGGISRREGLYKSLYKSLVPRHRSIF